MQIRPHRRDDADRIAEILADGWRTYAPFMPRDHLAGRTDVAARRTEIAEWLDDEFHARNEAIFMAAPEDGAPLGFIHMELGDKADLGAMGVVNLLYVDAAARGTGIGRELMAAGARWLLDTRPGPLVLSAFADNPYRHFYARLGGVETLRRQHVVAGSAIESVLYLWRDPAVLCAHTVSAPDTVR